jgi:hypothetical protein
MPKKKFEKIYRIKPEVEASWYKADWTFDKAGWPVKFQDFKKKMENLYFNK